MSRPRTALFLFAWSMALGLTVEGFLWPRMIPYYYPLPVSSSSSSASSSFPSGVQSGSAQYMYDWNTYNQNYPHSSVLYPSSPSDQATSYIPPSQPHSSPLSSISRWFQKPWLTWKLAKFGLRSPAPSPCSSSVSTPSISASSLFPSLSSALTPSPSGSSSYPPCTTKTTVCCSTGISGASRPHFIQTHVSSSYPSTSTYDRYSSQVHYPSNYHYHSPSSYSSGGSSTSLTPQASEQAYDFVSSK